PPTLDHTFLIETARAVEIAPADEDQTNLGDALAWSVRDVRATPARKKVVILLTDGQNQPGVPHALGPVSAARLAGDLGVIVHAVALGPTSEDEGGPDLRLLGEMVREAGGQLFQASSSQALTDVFKTIDRLERSPLKGTIQTRYSEWFGPWALAAGIAAVLDRWLVHGRWRRLP
ncbi:MAG TPA: VWA domain-containing protein, partial [Isosphaeraceae bacterium]|nr:VWA domain-containing protein [Isosphaeraceae bacterium]